MTGCLPCLPACRCCDYCSTLDCGLKALTLVMAVVSQYLALAYGVPYAATLGLSFQLQLTVASAGILTDLVYILTYSVSSSSRGLVRASALEVVHHSVCSLVYLCSAAYLSWAVQRYLWPLYMNLSEHSAYLPMCLCYLFGGGLGVVHCGEAIRAYRNR